MKSMKSNGLALEYQRDYAAARGNLNISHLINNPSANGKCSVFGLSFGKQSFNDFLSQLRALNHDVSDSFVVAEDAR
jgi:hypothetical protein